MPCKFAKRRCGVARDDGTTKKTFRLSRNGSSYGPIARGPSTDALTLAVTLALAVALALAVTLALALAPASGATSVTIALDGAPDVDVVGVRLQAPIIAGPTATRAPTTSARLTLSRTPASGVLLPERRKLRDDSAEVLPRHVDILTLTEAGGLRAAR